MMQTTPLAVLQGARPGERLVLVLATNDTGEPRILLREESWCTSLGWCVQKSLEMTPRQVAGLRAALGSVPSRWGTSAALGRQQTSGEDPPAVIPFPGRSWQAETA